MQKLILRQGRGHGKIGLDLGCLTPERSIAKHLPLPGDSQPTESLAVPHSRYPCLMSELISERHCSKDRLTTEMIVPLHCHQGRGACITGYPVPLMTTTPITGWLKQQDTQQLVPPVWSPWPWPRGRGSDNEPLKTRASDKMWKVHWI